MPVKRVLLWTFGVLLGAYVVHVATLAALPYAIMSRVLAGLSEQAGTNEFTHPPLATHESRQIVRPSPDLAYSSLVFDVSGRPLRVRVPLTPPYTSLSGFAANTDNFFAVNDQSAGGSEIDVVLVGPSTPRGAVEGRRVVESPSDRGLLLVRRVVPGTLAFPAIDEARRQATADPLPPPG
jgi:uncharacterized membrane protein